LKLPENQSDNNRNLIDYLEIKSKELQHKIIFLFDADRTLCEPDTSRIFNDLVGINLLRIKSGFKKHGYTYPGFLNNAQIYNELTLQKYNTNSQLVAKDVKLYPGVKQLIEKISKFADVLIVTAGIKEIWEEIFRLNEISNVMFIGGLHKENTNFIIGKNEKGIIASYFKKQKRDVIAFGDSGVDTLMLLNADLAFLVVNHKNNWDIVDDLIDQKLLHQISFKDFKHPNIPQTSYYDLLNDIIYKKYEIEKKGI